MKGSSLAVTFISPEEFDRQKKEREAKLEAQQQQQPEEEALPSEQKTSGASQTVEASDTLVEVAASATVEDSAEQPTYAAVDDVSVFGGGTCGH